ncbi:deleted in malignant brain tumors 1 protein [Hyperolius riggenbachi]|uniref:deleted in malignant brain tumors 1 protein n=1 Tax=Hyperolius riggenbachi TaxID=752182 RepID=UPI0035A39F5D
MLILPVIWALLWMLHDRAAEGATTKRPTVSSDASTTKAESPPSDLQLADGEHACAGRVEIYHRGAWQAVCDDAWNRANAEVVCRQAGCGSPLLPLARYGHGDGAIILDDVSCSGREQVLWQCSHREYYVHDCGLLEHVGVICSEPRTLAPDAPLAISVDLRLVNGWSKCNGRVEVFYNNSWGTVCDDFWDIDDATVVCRQLRCGTAVLAPGIGRFGEGNGTIVLDDVNCAGSESNLGECLHREWTTHNCVHGEDAGVICSDNGIPQAKDAGFTMAAKENTPETETPPTLRLVNGSHSCEGRLEIYYRGVWGTVCDDLWGLAAATVVCRQLGCGQASDALGLSHFGQGTGKIWLDDVNCKGTEAAVWKCTHRPWATHDCDHSEDAGVVCSSG